MLKKYRTIILTVIVGFLVIQVGLNWRILFPGSFFEYEEEYKYFKINSDREVSNEIYKTLDEVIDRLSHSRHFGKDSYDIFLCYDFNTYNHFAKKVGRSGSSQGFNLQPLNHIFINVTYIQELKESYKGEYLYSILEGNLAHIIAHEICHQLIAEEIGYFKMINVDRWKLEGFCEYSASMEIKKTDPDYKFEDFCVSYFAGGFDQIPKGRQFYVKSLLMTEYLIEFKGLNFKQIENSHLTENQIMNQLRDSKNFE